MPNPYLLHTDVIIVTMVSGIDQLVPHTHATLEINIILNNTAIIRSVHHSHILRPGDIFLARPFEPHWLSAKEENKPVRWVLIKFPPSIIRHLPQYGHKLLAPFYHLKQSPLLPRSSSYAKDIIALVNAAVDERQREHPCWEMSMHTCFLNILIQIYRYMVCEGHALASPELGMIHAIEHMLSHITEDHTKDVLFELAGLRKTAFYSQFKQMTGLTPNEFIVQMRIQHAVTRLFNSPSTPITEIAFESGFQSLTYFNRCFKQIVGISPKAYRGFVLSMSKDEKQVEFILDESFIRRRTN